MSANIISGTKCKRCSLVSYTSRFTRDADYGFRCFDKDACYQKWLNDMVARMSSWGEPSNISE